jgi:hypothetical protein
MPNKPALAKESAPKRSPKKSAIVTKTLVIPLNTPPALAAQLQQLQQAFAEVCNAISPVVSETRCWNRVALHHLVYRSLRERFPQLGSQLICNAIYSVSRTCRLIFQAPGSPFNLTILGNRPLPQMRFAPEAPVYFDRHTLSIRGGVVSMLTLGGRIRFRLSISEADEQRFRQERLREILLLHRGEQYQLHFIFAGSVDDDDAADAVPASAPKSAAKKVAPAATNELPEYVVVLDESAADPVKELGEVV